MTLDGELNIYMAGALKQEILREVRDRPAPRFGLSGVTEIDSAGVQLLLLAQREGARLGRRVAFVDPSPALIEVVDLLGLSELRNAFTTTPPGAAVCDEATA